MALIGINLVILAIGVGIGLIVSIIGLFVGNIIIFDSIALALLAGFLSNGLLNIHPAFSLIIGIVTLVLFLFIQHTRFGFWIIGGLLSLVWGFIFAIIAGLISGGDMIWVYVIWALGALIVFGLHLKARSDAGL